MSRAQWLGALGVALSALAVYGERDADACGGCFTPPPPPPPPGAPPSSVDSVITAERMIFSISKDQTTLYDEITYSGNPASFAWVLPIRGQVEVGLSADILFGTIDQLTASTVVAPSTDCPPIPSGCESFGGGGGGSGFGCGAGSFASGFAAPGAYDAGAAADPDSGVTVLTQAQVGPYEMVQLKSSDGSALTKWLDGHGFRVPAADAAVVARYVADGMDFLALKLIPGEGVRAMQPVRVTTQGAFPVLPLRMVGVGTGPTTGITLWVVADGRWEPQNFPAFTIGADELVWDWATSSSNYEPLRLQKEAALGGRGWQIEASIDLSRYAVSNVLDTAIQNNPTGHGGYVEGPAPRGSGRGHPPDAGVDAGRGGDGAPPDGATLDAAADAGDAGAPVDAAVTDAVSDGGVDSGEPADAGHVPPPPSELQLAAEDVAVLFKGIAGPNARVTRMRTDIVHSALSSDLVIGASRDSSELSSSLHPKKQRGEPSCTTYDQSCDYLGDLPRHEAWARTGSSGATAPADPSSSSGCAGCRTTSGPVGWRTTVALVLAFAGFGAYRARRRRRATRR